VVLLLDQGWQFHSAASVAATVIPVLLLTLVLERSVLSAAISYSRDMQRGAEKLEERLRGLPQPLRAIAQSVLRMSVFSPSAMGKFMAALYRPSVVVVYSFFAELVALLGVAAPPAWTDDGPGRVVGFVLLGLVGYVLLALLGVVIVGLSAVASQGEEEESPTAPEPPDPPT
jgi:hypothetical protein